MNKIANDGNETKQEDLLKEKNTENIETLQEETKISVLATLYKDEGIFSQILSIIAGRELDPSSLIDSLGDARIEFKKLSLPDNKEF